MTPTYPVLSYGHGSAGGDAIAGGFVYRGTTVPQLFGKFIFGDISTGRLWYSNFSDMLAADDGVAANGGGDEGAPRLVARSDRTRRIVAGS